MQSLYRGLCAFFAPRRQVYLRALACEVLNDRKSYSAAVEQDRYQPSAVLDTGDHVLSAGNDRKFPCEVE